jgi:hypothetical protein
VIRAYNPGKQKQEDHKFKGNLGYPVAPCLQNKTKTKKRKKTISEGWKCTLVVKHLPNIPLGPKFDPQHHKKKKKKKKSQLPSFRNPTATAFLAILLHLPLKSFPLEKAGEMTLAS